MVAYPGFLTLVATLAASATQATFIDEIHQLVTRQTTTPGVGIDPSLFPPQCKDICLPINDLGNGACASFDCLCGTRISSSVSGCLQCALNVSGLASFIPQFQEIYDNYANSCKAAGETVPPFKFKLDDNPSPSGTDDPGNSTDSSGGSSGSSGSSGGSPGSSGGSSGSSNSSDSSNTNGGSPDVSGGSPGSGGGNSSSGNSSESSNPNGGTGGGDGISSIGGNRAFQLHVTAAGLACVLATALLLVA